MNKRQRKKQRQSIASRYLAQRAFWDDLRRQVYDTMCQPLYSRLAELLTESRRAQGHHPEAHRMMGEIVQ